ncbi:Mth938-like domain-containing protein [Castellaniella sp.]|uniref:Mth938-like domain-containing protein n=1 Tax=Castellaniella sp. TaxID=1955812 RepID=UPI00355D177D
MLLQKESNPSLNTITAYGEGYLEINRERFETSVCLAPEGPIRRMPLHGIAEIDGTLLKDLVGLGTAQQDPMAFLDDEPAPPTLPADAPEVVLIGTGLRQAFLPPDVVRPLLMAGIGVEAMTTHSAARTYNILMSEERRVLALLILGDAA